MDMVVCSVAHFASMTHTHIHILSTHPLCVHQVISREISVCGRRRGTDTAKKVIGKGRKRRNGHTVTQTLPHSATLLHSERRRDTVTSMMGETTTMTTLNVLSH